MEALHDSSPVELHSVIFKVIGSYKSKSKETIKNEYSSHLFHSPLLVKKMEIKKLLNTNLYLENVTKR